MMFARGAFTLMLAGALGLTHGCSAPLGSTDEGDDRYEDGARLVNEGDDEVRVLPNDTTELSVRYFDAYGVPAAGVTVAFALDDYAAGSSLSPITAVTDQDGRARSLLRVGSYEKKQTFSVRVSAEGVEPLFISIVVKAAANVSATVEVVYRGQRQLESRTVTALPSTTCETALEAGIPGELTYTYQKEETQKKFRLGPGLHYAVVAWGKDNTNAKVAQGCAMVDAPITDDADEANRIVRVELIDTPMKLMGSYPLTLQLDVTPSVERLADALRESVRAGLPTGDAPQGEHFLAALEQEFMARELAVGWDAERARLASDLEAELRASETGILAYAEHLTTQLGNVGSRLEMRTTCAAGLDAPMTLSIESLRALSREGGQILELSAAPDYVAPPASIQAAYSDTYAALQIATLSVQLGLGNYGRLLLSTLTDMSSPETDVLAGCAALSALVDREPLLQACDEECALATCRRALAQTRSQVVSGLTQLDGVYPFIGLRGSVYAHERTGDGIVDDLGPASLEGNWGNTNASGAADPVVGRVPVPRDGMGALNTL